MTSGMPTRMAAWLESAWLARYLDRQLEGEELAWFEGYLLDKPELLEAVEVDNLIRDGIVNHLGSDVVHELPRSRSRFPGGLAFATCAGLMIGVVGEKLYSSRYGPDADVVPNPPRIVLETMRGSTVRSSRSVGTGDSPYFLVEVAMPLYSTDIRLEMQGEKTALVSSADGFVTFLLPKAKVGKDDHIFIRYTLSGKDEKIEVPVDVFGGGP